MSLTKESISITVPAFNEEETIEAVVREALEVLSGITTDYEVLVVDDGSNDATPEIADRLALEERAVRVIHHRENTGFTGAIKSCFENARCDLIFLAPADRQVNLSELSKFVDLIGDCDIVAGYFIKRADPFYRSFYSWGFHLLCHLLFGIKQRQISTLSLWRRSVSEKINIESRPPGTMVVTELFSKATRMGCTIKEVGIVHYPRTTGEPKGESLSVIVRTFLGMLHLWWRLNVASKLRHRSYE